MACRKQGERYGMLGRAWFAEQSGCIGEGGETDEEISREMEDT